LACDSARRLLPSRRRRYWTPYSNQSLNTFTVNGLRLPVYEDGRGQFVIDENGEEIRGIWCIPRGEWTHAPGHRLAATAAWSLSCFEPKFTSAD